MKVLTKEEEQAHYRATVSGGLKGATWGMAIGAGGVWAASKRFPMFRSATLPLKAFLAMSSSTFAAIIEADRASRAYDTAHNPEKARLAQHERQEELDYEATHSTTQRLTDWAKENRYPIVFGSWVASMGASLGIVNRNKYLTGAQKLVQARIYAQGLTLAVLLISFYFETNDASKGKGRWETIKIIDPDDPTHKHIIEKRIHHERYEGEDQWREMIEAEEAKMKEREKARGAAKQRGHEAAQREKAAKQKADQHEQKEKKAKVNAEEHEDKKQKAQAKIDADA